MAGAAQAAAVTAGVKLTPVDFVLLEVITGAARLTSSEAEYERRRKRWSKAMRHLPKLTRAASMTLKAPYLANSGRFLSAKAEKS